MINPEQKAVLAKYTKAAKKVIYNPERMKQLAKMMETPEGTLTAVQTVVTAIDKLRPVPSEIAGLLGVNCYMIMVDVMMAATEEQPDPQELQQIVGMIMSSVKTGAGGVVGRMEQGQMPEADPEPGDAPGPDNTQMHEGAESPMVEEGEGEEEDGMLAKMRRGVPA